MILYSEKGSGHSKGYITMFIIAGNPSEFYKDKHSKLVAILTEILPLRAKRVTFASLLHPRYYFQLGTVLGPLEYMFY